VPMLALDADTRLEICHLHAASAIPADWLRLCSPSSSEQAYPAALEISLLGAANNNLLADIHAIAVRFARQYSQRASLTILLPQTPEPDWTSGGDVSAAKMLVATLACEWGPKALRINALEVPQNSTPQQLARVLHYLAGPAAQYLTGQTLRWTNPTT
jgi:hypothetical protein